MPKNQVLILDVDVAATVSQFLVFYLIHRKS